MAEPAAATDDEPGRRGSLVIADRVVEKLARGAAREVDHTVSTGAGWSLGLLPGSSGALPSASATVAGERARIGVEIAAPWPVPAHQVAAAVRDHVRTRVADLSGMRVDAVDVTVAEVVHLPAARRSERTEGVR